METFAIIGTSLLFLCPLPQTIMCIRNGNADGLASSGLMMWMFGCLMMFIYLMSLPNTSIYVLINYGVGIIFSFIQCFYKAFPRKKI
jgi:uncharacterized protein with PQ loop repeat